MSVSFYKLLEQAPHYQNVRMRKVLNRRVGVSVCLPLFLLRSHSAPPAQFHVLTLPIIFEPNGFGNEQVFRFLLSGSFAKLRAVFQFRRRLDYHISSVYLPEVILVVLSWCTFFITPTAVPARISLSITTILTTILLSSTVNSEIPKVLIVHCFDLLHLFTGYE